LLLDLILEGAPLHVLHDDVVHAAVAAHVVDLDDVGMAQPGRGPRFPREAAQELVVVGELGAQDLDGHPPVQQPVDGLVNHRHAAVADLAAQFVTPAQLAAGHAGPPPWAAVRPAAAGPPGRMTMTVMLSGPPRRLASSTSH